MRILFTTMSLSDWEMNEFKESWFFGIDLTFKYRYFYFRLLGMEITLGW